jgi:murein DD-endopeptidase MepM/ murein hydrolase activator NlpD
MRHSSDHQRAPVDVEFPLRGEWAAYHTPADRVPSHGTNEFGQRFAYDFLRIERDAYGWKFWRTPTSRYYLRGIRLEECYGWSEAIYAPFEGMVVTAQDGWPERRFLHPVVDAAAALLWTPLNFLIRRDLRVVLGNHIILSMSDAQVFALFAHARTGSIKVQVGDLVRSGQHLADVGHSGNSTAPHLHFQLMDRSSVRGAKGIPCRFKHYEVLRAGGWFSVNAGTPGRREFVRYAA